MNAVDLAHWHEDMRGIVAAMFDNPNIERIHVRSAQSGSYLTEITYK